MQQHQYDAIIIGAGHNGLVTAGYLAQEGLKVLVLERLEMVGGAVVTDELTPGFNIPYCAYILHIMQGRVIDDLKLRDNGLDIIPFTTFRFDPFPDGNHIMTYRENHKNARELARFSEKDAQAFPEWASFWERASAILHSYWFREPPTIAEVYQDVRGTSDEEVWETMLTVSMRDLVDRYFEHPQVKAHFIDAQDAGDPSAPGSILSLAYLRVNAFTKPENYGIPRGGMSQLPFAMARYAESLGVEIRLNTVVDKVIVENGTAVGVRLENGEEIRSFMVVSNADPKRTYNDLVDSADVDPATRSKVDGLTTRANCVKLLVALRELPDFSSYLGQGYDPRLTAYFRICPSVEYFQQSWDDAKNGYPSSCPVMNVQMPSIYDKSLTPPGHHVLSAWTLYAPAELKEGSWDVEGPKVGEKLIDILTTYAPNFRESIVDWTLQTPEDIEIRQFLTDGNIRHIDITSKQIFHRPHALPLDHRPLLHVRLGHPPRRRDHRRPGLQRRQGHPQRPGARRRLAPVLPPHHLLPLGCRLQRLQSPFHQPTPERPFLIRREIGITRRRRHRFPLYNPVRPDALCQGHHGCNKCRRQPRPLQLLRQRSPATRARASGPGQDHPLHPRRLQFRRYVLSKPLHVRHVAQVPDRRVHILVHLAYRLLFLKVPHHVQRHDPVRVPIHLRRIESPVHRLPFLG